jgi:hypothetical protein
MIISPVHHHIIGSPGRHDLLSNVNENSSSIRELDASIQISITIIEGLAA